MIKDHNLTQIVQPKEILYERRPLMSPQGKEVPGLYNAWVIFNNPKQLNSYTTGAVKEVILKFQEASQDRAVVNIVFTASGDRAFCTGGNTKEYAEYYAGRPQEYKQYMRLFNDMINAILLSDKPVINRVNGMRVGGGQEIGMACDFSVAVDTARFSQAGPKHGSAPDGGSTDFLHLYVGFSQAMESCTLCKPWSAHKAYRLGLLNRIVPALKVDGKWIANPLVYTNPYTNEFGEILYGEYKTGDDYKDGKEVFKKATADLSLLDEVITQYCYDLALTMPGCLMKTIESLRKKKLEHWQRNSETNRSWLSLNMMTEAKAGFRAFNNGAKENREVDFLELRRILVQDGTWDESLEKAIMPNEG